LVLPQVQDLETEGRMMLTGIGMGFVALEEETEEECQHDEHDHGICLDCEADISDKLRGQAEAYWEGER
jgi:hypothetical protein